MTSELNAITNSVSPFKAVDVWMQHPTSGFLTHPMFESLARWTRRDKSGLEGEQAVESTIASMDAGQVGLGLISAWYAPGSCLISNESVASLCQSHPHRFRGMASADILNPVRAVKEIAHYVQNKGFVAVRIIPWLWERYLTDALFYPIYTECVRLGVPVCIQVGQTGPMRPSDMGRPIPYLERVALDFPDLVIVGGHIGEPWTREMIFLCTKFRNVYIDTSAYKPSRFPTELIEFMKSHGKHKVMMGSNYPMIPHSEIYNQLKGLGLSQDHLECFLWKNANRVFKLTTAASL